MSEVRICPICGNEYPLTREFFYTAGKGYFSKNCIPCYKQVDKQRRAALSIKKNIYFVINPSSGLIKIGVTNNVRQRFMNLRLYSPELEMLGVHEGSTVDERDVHSKFAEYRVKGEWFKDCEAIREHIADYCHMPDLSDKSYRIGKRLHQKQETINGKRNLLHK